MQKRPLADESFGTNFVRIFGRSACRCCRRNFRLFVVERQNGGHLGGSQCPVVEVHLVQVAVQGILRRAKIRLRARYVVYRRIGESHAACQQPIYVTTEQCSLKRNANVRPRVQT